MRKDSNGREVFPPMEYVEEEMKARGWTSRTLAGHMNRSHHYVLAWLQEKWPIDEELADGLSRAFGTGPEVWLNLQATWDDATEKE